MRVQVSLLGVDFFVLVLVLVLECLVSEDPE
jgi:hypothetical protein